MPVPPDPLGPPIEEPPPTPEDPKEPVRDPDLPGQPDWKYARSEASPDWAVLAVPASAPGESSRDDHFDARRAQALRRAAL
jgi:hypothetical protein